MELIEKIGLSNGLVVELYDCSRLVAGDRWFVKLLVQAQVKVSAEAFAHLSDADAIFHEFIETRGDVVLFDKKLERNFIDHREKDQVLSYLVQKFKEDTLPYIGHPNFAQGLIKLHIKDFLEKRTWWK
ncbi:MAG: hypothetical protein ACUVQV_01810 [Dissulfurimicrobium sp.]|uniref:hypothetical protein n=1 Tax=Dissulfurimicrobium sp. TaxID=2022436 RepID=UPI004049D000